MRGAPAKDIGAPDERQHANYVSHLLQGEGLPVLDPKDPNLYETYQSHQPPLYYGLAAGWSLLFGLDPQSPDDGFMLRLLNHLIGMGTLVGIAMAVTWGLGRLDVGWTAAAFAGMLPMFVALHSAVTNDPLLFFWMTWCLAFALRAHRQGWTPGLALICGVLAGLALWTKSTALALLPVLWVALLVSNCRSPRVWLLCLALPIALAAPWFTRNHLLYGDPLGMGVFQQAFVGTAQAAMFIEGFGAYAYWTQWVGWWTARSFVGVFGYMDIFLSDHLYGVVLLVLAACAVGWAFSHRAEEADSQATARGFHLILFALIVVVLALFIQFNMTYFQAQARYLYPAIVSFATGLAIGLHHWTRRARWTWVVPVVGLGALNLYTLRLLADTFPRLTAP